MTPHSLSLNNSDCRILNLASLRQNEAIFLQWMAFLLSFIGSKSFFGSPLARLHRPLVIRVEMLLLLQQILPHSFFILPQLLMLELFLLLGEGMSSIITAFLSDKITCTVGFVNC